MNGWTGKFEGWLEAHLPPGIPVQREQSVLAMGLGLSIGWAALSYFCTYTMAFSRLYVLQNGQRILDPTARMADFGAVFRFTLAGYLLWAARLILRGLGFQAYHRQGSMSIYLMRRLPDPREYTRRCWTVPVTGTALCLVLAAVTTALCYLIYMTCTPASCLVPGQWARFWSAWIGR